MAPAIVSNGRERRVWQCRRTHYTVVLLLVAACRGEPLGGWDVSWAHADTIPTIIVTNRFVARPVLEQGDTLRLFTDTGGGLFLYRDVVERLGLGVDSTNQVTLPAFRVGNGIPEPLGSPGGHLFILDSREGGFGEWDGMLGQQWFADRIWLFDYPQGHLLLWSDSTAAPPTDPEHEIALGFKTDSTGHRVLSFPRIRVQIDGDSLDLLFDTGATVRLTAQAVAQLPGDNSERGTSFITSSMVNAWRSRHPDWRVIDNADANVAGMAMIEVPEISVAGYNVGPVWFTERPDRNFHEYMSQFMDRRVEGALGGSALQYFAIIADYPSARATFSR